VVAADDVAVDDAVLVSGDEAAVAGGTREALDVVDGRPACRRPAERPQNHLTRRDVLTATGARSRRTKHPARDTTTKSYIIDFAPTHNHYFRSLPLNKIRF